MGAGAGVPVMAGSSVQAAATPVLASTAATRSISRGETRASDRPFSPARPVRPYSRVSTIGEISGNPLGRLVRTAVLRFSGYHDEQDPTTAKMIERSLDEMPLRGVALLGGGKVNLGTVDGLVDLLNKRPDRMVLRLGRALIAMLPGR